MSSDELKPASDPIAPQLDHWLLECRDQILLCIEDRLDEHLLRRLDPEDVFQEVAMIACNRFDSFRGRQPVEFLRWIRRIVRNHVRDCRKFHLAAEKRSVLNEVQLARFETPSGAQLKLPDRNTETPSQRFEAENRLDELFGAIDELPEMQREAIGLVKVERLTVAEAAEKLGVEPRVVSLALIRGAHALASAIEKRRPGLPYLSDMPP